MRRERRRRRVSVQGFTVRDTANGLCIPRFKKGCLHLLRDGYVRFVGMVFRGNRGRVVGRGEVERAWVGVVGGFWGGGKGRERERERERLEGVLGKAVRQVCFWRDSFSLGGDWNED